jgi:hypothetical protein
VEGERKWNGQLVCRSNVYYLEGPFFLDFDETLTAPLQLDANLVIVSSDLIINGHLTLTASTTLDLPGSSAIHVLGSLYLSATSSIRIAITLGTTRLGVRVINCADLRGTLTVNASALQTFPATFDFSYSCLNSSKFDNVIVLGPNNRQVCHTEEYLSKSFRITLREPPCVAPQSTHATILLAPLGFGAVVLAVAALHLMFVSSS